MAASFPTSVKTFTDVTDGVDTAEATQLNQIHDEVEALETLFYRNMVHYDSDNSQSLSTGLTTIINYEDVQADPQSAVTIGSSWKFEPPADGVYVIEARVAVSGATWGVGDSTRMHLYVNGTEIRKLDEYIAESANSNQILLKGMAILDLNTTDDVNIRVWHNEVLLTTTSEEETNCFVAVLIQPPAA